MKNLTEDANIILSNNMRELFSKLDTVIIDEISMVRVDVFNQINKIFSQANNNKRKYLGKQVILFGDLFQLPPVADREGMCILLELNMVEEFSLILQHITEILNFTNFTKFLDK